MRLFEGERNLGDFHLYPNRFGSPGDHIVQHVHSHGHLAIFGPGQYRVHAVVRGEEREVAINEYGVAWIAPLVPHRIEFLGGAPEGRMVCIFARYGEAGVFDDPKR